MLIAAFCWIVWEIPPQMAGFPQNTPSYSYALESFLLNGFIILLFLDLLQRNFSDYSEAGSFVGELVKIFWVVTTGTGISVLLFHPNEELLQTIVFQYIKPVWIYKIEFAAVIGVLLFVYTIWRKLIFFGRSPYLVAIWKFFEGFLFFSLLFHAVPHPYLHRYEFFDWIESAWIGFSWLLALMASFNLNWIALLRYREKWFALLVFLILFVCLAYFFALRQEPLNGSESYFDLTESLFISAMLIFIAIYSVFSFLTILFNLPTSNIIERKFSELSALNRLLAHEFRNEEQFFEKILDIAINTFRADAAWLEIPSRNRLIGQHIFEPEARYIKQTISQTGYNWDTTKKFIGKNLPWSAEYAPFATILIIPLQRRSKLVGILVLLAKHAGIFDNVLLPHSTLNHYAAQAALALDNLLLLADAVDSERFQAEIAAAKKVREALLPALNFRQGNLQVIAKTNSPELIGGDFYDYYRFSSTRIAFILGDVAGKGTSAVFHMAQMKGIFQSLAPLDLSPEVFMIHANQALTNCLPPQMFITAIYLVVDTEKQMFSYARAGHCPLIYVDSATGKAHLVESKGIGLGIMRSKKFAEHIVASSTRYQHGDLIVLYTDGVVEMRAGSQQEEFGFERLRQFCAAHYQLSAEQLLSKAEEKLLTFAKNENNSDDFSLLFIKL
ncbi:MAG: PP2C family protein-serine/threonine phosphatase [Cytophagales bacterium]|nr:serine/threonine-protein phosphatase [Bernardetiaceae bacterium]MDW8203516.1 PP2C family protein-serine/threonine phosphatase [Cytophagales bacterium]